MFKLAKSKINFKGWEVIVNDIPLEVNGLENNFTYEDIDSKSLEEAIITVVRQLDLDRELFTECLEIVGKERFDYVIRLCGPHKNLSIRERNRIIFDLQELEADKQAVHENVDNILKLKNHDYPIHEFKAVTISNVIITREVQKWLADHDIQNLEQLDGKEDDFFNEHEALGGIKVFQLYNIAQILMEHNERSRM